MAKQGINKATIIGFVGQDPKVIVQASGDKSAFISVATGSSWTDEQGNKQKVTDWHNIAGFKGAATYIEKAIKKGTKVFIEGEMKKHRWTDKNGQIQTDTQIIVKDIQVLDNGRDNTPQNQQNGTVAQYAQQNQQPAHKQEQRQPNPVDDFDDDIPF